ncbi:MAG: polymerase subunit gamma/tau, partial [Pseudomonadota bacterium]
QAVYKPVQGRFKVFMIDEVHMLTGHAFNAMLKTLEEPPEYLKFVLATTDPQKVPVTVLSRCLQFNLRPMAPETVLEHLTRVLATENVPAEAGALRLLARAARGSMRDALSLTDQAIAFGGGQLQEAAVRQMLGSADRGHVLRLIDALARGDGKAVVDTSEALRLNGLSAAATLEDMAMVLQRMAVCQAVPGMAVDEQDPESVETARLAELLPADETQLLYSLCLHGRGELGLAPDEYAALNMVLLRLLAFKPAGAAEKKTLTPAEAAAAPLPPAAAAVPAPAPASQPEPVAVAAMPAVAAPLPAQALAAAPAPVVPVVARVPAMAAAEPVRPAPAQPPARPSPPPRREPEPEPEYDFSAGYESDAEQELYEMRAAARPAPQQARPAMPPPAQSQVLPPAPPEAAAPQPQRPAVLQPAALQPVVGADADFWFETVMALIQAERVTALVRELALQSELVRRDADEWLLRVASSSLVQAGVRDRLQAALAQAGHGIRLRVEAGEVGDTPARRLAAAAAERQRQAEDTMLNDPFVQAMLREFGGKIVPGSIKPV